MHKKDIFARLITIAMPWQMFDENFSGISFFASMLPAATVVSLLLPRFR